MKLEVGTRVTWYSRRDQHCGTVRRINARSVTVELDNGEMRRVEARRLRPVEDLAPVQDNVIRFPEHACGVGTRVWFRTPSGMPMPGTIVGINPYSAKIRPEDGSTAYYTVRHPFVRRRSEDLPRRPDGVILHEIARCYARLNRTWNREIRPHMEQQVNRRLKVLFKEFGRYVPEQEAINFALRPEGGNA